MENERADRVLVVDDDHAIRSALERSLRRLGYDVQTAADGEEGLRAALANPHDVILTDIRMPGLDGHTLLRRLKAHDLHSALVVMSAHGTMDDVIDALRNGAVDYLKKPWTAAELVAAVGRAAEIAHARRLQRGEQVAAGQPLPDGAAFGAAAQTTRDAESGVRSVLAQLGHNEVTLPAIPAVWNELRSVLAEPGTAIENVVALIERDQRYSSQVIRLANSVLYLGLPRLSDIRSAVNRVGFRQIENIVETSFAQKCYGTSDARFRQIQAKMWKYSLARAVSMRALADLAGAASGLDPAVAYLAGLMSDVGAAHLLGFISGQERVSSPAAAQTSLADSLAMIRDHHQAIGAALVRSWSLDPIVALIAGNHHADAPPAPPNPYWSLSILASEVANQLAPGDDITLLHPVSATVIDRRLIDRCGAELRIGNSALKQVLSRLARELDALLETMN